VPAPDPKPETPSPEREALERKTFLEGLITRGEAVAVPEGAPMPPGATHEIVGRTDDGQAIVRRRRFSLS
jgi:hypothetical protein